MNSDSEDEKNENRWFHAEVNEVPLLQKCLRPLTDGENPTGNVDYFCVSPDGMYLASTHAYLEFSVVNFAAYYCPEKRVLRLHLRHLEDRIATAVDIYAEEDGISLCFTGERPNYNALLLSMRDREGNVIYSSEIELVLSYPGSMELRSSDVNYTVSIDMQTQTFMQLIEYLSLYGFEVQATVQSTGIMFRAVNEEIILWEEKGIYQIEHEEGEIVQYPFLLKFDLYQKSALLNAAILSERVWLHQLVDLRTVVVVPVQGHHSIQFCYQP
uniref:uncharacterized protein LOC101299907 isoform X1 n=1 Tax=Fragaria vesca subsp. vesca TaxID=101020 RepID=UPI0005CAC496|nr:PREDICTED: uncharacterized protein LOC101299907 isoform X1 [Fragaria vesca subsp. vesca]